MKITINKDRYRIWNMHGPTVYASDDEGLSDLLERLQMLNHPRSNAGTYSLHDRKTGLILEVSTRTYDV